MSHIKLRILLNKGQRGIALNKLERISEEIRKFVEELGEDIDLSDPSAWIGVDFINSSLGFTTEYSYEVDAAKLGRFNEAIGALARGQYLPSLRDSTSSQFFNFAKALDLEELVDLETFSEDGTPHKFEVSRKTAILAQSPQLPPFRESIGAVQGKIHSFHMASKPPFFNLRELSTGNLVKCLYPPEDYSAVLDALKIREQVIHVRGRIVTDTRERNIDHIRVTEILLAERYVYQDVEKFLNSGKTQ
jgi:hypothetical protein